MIHRIVRIVCVIARVFHGRARAVPGTRRAHAAIGLFRHPQDTGPAYIRMQNPLIQHSHSAAHVWCGMVHGARRNTILC